MARRPRDQRTDCAHHVMGRGCRGQPVLRDRRDHEHFCDLLNQVVERFDWTVLAWVLMPNHHHLVVRLAEPNLDRGMHRLHGLFGQRWNERNESTGHVFFRRYKSIPLLRPGATARVLRYVELNPVRAGLCERPEEWGAGGYAATIGHRRPEAFHDTRSALDAMAPTTEGPIAARHEYERNVLLRLAEVRGRGTPSDVRPPISEIVIPGDLESLHEAHETWWYSVPELADATGLNERTVRRWLADSSSPSRRGAAVRRWAMQSA